MARQPKSSKSRKPLATEGWRDGGRWCIRAQKTKQPGRSSTMAGLPVRGWDRRGRGCLEGREPLWRRGSHRLSAILPEAEREDRSSLVPHYSNFLFSTSATQWEPTNKGTSKMYFPVLLSEEALGDRFEGSAQATGIVSHVTSKQFYSPPSNFKDMSF